jgi:hypothetical protein
MPRPRAVSRTERVDDPVEVARPFIRVAAVSFAAGFWGYLAALPLIGR